MARLSPQMRLAARLLEPAGLDHARRAVRVNRRHGVRLRDYRQAHAASLDRLPPWIALDEGVVYDIGANHGDWTDAVTVAVPGARVVAVEPFPPLASELARRFAGRGQITVDARAVDAASGESVFHVGARDVLSSLLEFDPSMTGYYGEGAVSVEEITVPAVSLDELVGEQSVSLMKVDVQGAELRVFEGGTQALARTRAVVVEANLAGHYRGGSTFASVYEALIGHGFDFWDMGVPFRQASGRALWVDAVYARPPA